MKKTVILCLVAVLAILIPNVSSAALRADDLMVYDSNAGYWYGLSIAGGTNEVLVWGQQWGWPGADTVSGDYNGDGTNDMAVYDQGSGSWYILSKSGEVLVWGTQWGWSGAETVPGDYNGDGKSDMAVYDQPSGSWYILSTDGGLIAWAQQWGWNGAETVPGDYNGDGKDDLAVYDQNSGYWYIYSMDGEALVWGTQWGWSGAETVPGDYDGDGKDDLAVYDQNSGYWYILSVSGEVIAWAKQWGWSGAYTVPGDFNGDDASDLAVFDDASGSWYILSIADGTDKIITWGTQWGWSGAVPVKGNYGGSVQAYVEFADNVVKIDEDELITVTGIDTNGDFTIEVTDGSSGVQVGDILYSTEGEGYLRKVTAVKKGFWSDTVSTVQAVLTEGFGNLEMNETWPLVPGDLEDTQIFTNAVTMSTAGGVFSINLNNLELYDQVVANGSITLEPKCTLAITVDDYDLKYVNITLELNETAELVIGANATKSFTKEIDLLEMRFGMVLIGGVPVVPKLTLRLGVDGSVSANLETGVTQEARVKAGLKYRYGNLNTNKSINNEFEWITPSLSGDVSVKCYAGPQLSLLICGVAGGYAGVDAYLQFDAEASTSSDFNWELYAGLQANVGLEADFFGWDYDYGTEFDIYSTLLASSSESYSSADLEGTWSIWTFDANGTLTDLNWSEWGGPTPHTVGGSLSVSDSGAVSGTVYSIHITEYGDEITYWTWDGTFTSGSTMDVTLTATWSNESGDSGSYGTLFSGEITKD